MEYERLFTMQDVHALVLVAGIRGWKAGDSKQGTGKQGTGEALVEEFDAKAAEGDEAHRLTFPPDEPLFLLRGQDLCAVDTIHRYGEIAMNYGATERHLRGVAAAEDRFREWPAGKTKVPN
jgi:hypothetical protein